MSSLPSVYSIYDLDFFVLDAKLVHTLSIEEIDDEISMMDERIVCLTRMTRSMTDQIELNSAVHKQYSEALRAYTDAAGSGDQQRAAVLSGKLRDAAAACALNLGAIVGLANTQDQLDKHLRYRNRLIYARSGVKMRA